MAFFDNFPDEDQDALDADARQKILAAIAGGRGKPPLLGRPAQEQVSSQSPANGDSGDVFGRPTESPRLLGLGNQPRIPPVFTTVPSEEPSVPRSIFGGPSNAGSVLGAQPRPARPNVMPTREDFPTKPIPTWQKVLGVAAAPFVPNLTQSIFTGPERRSETQYREAVGDWERQQGDEARQANIENIRSEIKARDAKPAPEVKPEDEVFKDLIRQGKTPREAYEIMKQAGQKPPTPSFEEQTYQEWVKTHPGGTRLQFEKDKATATEKPQQPQRQLGITPDNRVIELKPGMTVPPGTKSLGGELSLTAKTEQGEQAGQSAMQYANDYLSGKQWTGPGDEALMEKFFELAKPSQGFRMTQAQIEMLQRSRDWMGSITAKAKHAFTPDAPWFSDTQRQQIVKTMNDLAKARGAVKPGATTSGPGAGSAGAATEKTYTQEDVDAAAKQFGMTADQIEQGFKAKGWAKKK